MRGFPGALIVRAALSLPLVAALNGCANSDYDPCVHGFYGNSLGQAIVATAMTEIWCGGRSKGVAKNDVGGPQAATARRATTEAELAAIDPLTTPLAAAGLVVLPSYDQLLVKARADAPIGATETAMAAQANLLASDTESWHQLIKKRGIFTETALRRDADRELESEVAGRYVVQADYREEKNEIDWFLSAPGSQERVWIQKGSPLGIGSENTQRFLSNIERFVRNHQEPTMTGG